MRRTSSNVACFAKKRREAEVWDLGFSVGAWVASIWSTHVLIMAILGIIPRLPHYAAVFCFFLRRKPAIKPTPASIPQTARLAGSGTIPPGGVPLPGMVLIFVP